MCPPPCRGFWLGQKIKLTKKDYGRNAYEHISRTFDVTWKPS